MHHRPNQSYSYVQEPTASQIHLPQLTGKGKNTPTREDGYIDQAQKGSHTNGRQSPHSLEPGNVFRTLENKKSHIKTHSVHHEVVNVKISPRFEAIQPVKESQMARKTSMTGLTEEQYIKHAQQFDANAEEDIAYTIALQQITDEDLEFEDFHVMPS